MAVDFFFNPPTLEIQPLRSVAIFRWQRLRNPPVQYAIAAEEQYLQFHLFLLQSLRHTQVGRVADPPYSQELGLSVRAGAVKAAVLVAASIIEAALRAIAEHRGYPLHANARNRTFGNVIRAWEDNGAPRPEVAEIWPTVRALREVRNFVHLHEAAAVNDADWANILQQEEQMLAGAQRAIEHVASLAA